MLKESEMLRHEQEGEADPDAPPASLLHQNPKTYFERIKHVMDKHVNGKPDSRTFMRLLSVIRDGSIDSKFPVQNLLDTSLADYLFRLATAEECDIVLNEYALA